MIDATPKPPEPLPAENFGKLPTGETLRYVAQELGLTEADATARLIRERQQRADAYHRDRLRDWRESYGPDPDDDDEDEEEEQ